jgi:TPR repeat protein
LFFQVGSPAVSNARARAEYLGALRKAAAANHAMAQMSMGMAYELGYGVAKDEQEALRWYELAAAQENVLALERLRLGALPQQSASTPF